MIRYGIGQQVYRYSGPPGEMRPWGFLHQLHEGSTPHREAFEWLCEQDIVHHFEWRVGISHMGQDGWVKECWSSLRMHLVIHDDADGALFRLFHPAVAEQGVILTVLGRVTLAGGGQRPG